MPVAICQLGLGHYALTLLIVVWKEGNRIIHGIKEIISHWFLSLRDTLKCALLCFLSRMVAVMHGMTRNKVNTILSSDVCLEVHGVMRW